MTSSTQQRIYGESPAIQEVMRTAELVSATDVAVLISGDSGTGKELFAKTIHSTGARSQASIITLDCACLAADKTETDVLNRFGDAIGKADGGTLLLDEVAALPWSVQVQLLRFLETGEYQPADKAEICHCNVRVIALSSYNLESLVAKGEFRQDLFYRLNIVPLELPPLRKRIGDLDLLLDIFFRDLVAQHKMPPPDLTKSALNKLATYPWPGNVRELKNLCERLLILMSGKTVDVSNLPGEIIDYQPQKSPGFVLPAAGIDLNQLEYDLMQQALDNARGNKSHAARLLGLSRDAFLYRLKKYMFQ